MVVKVSGKIDGKEVIFERDEGDRWNATVPYDLDGMYVVELRQKMMQAILHTARRCC